MTNSAIMDFPDRALQENNADSFVMYGTSDIADMRYITGFSCTDPVVYIKETGQRGVIIVSQMEIERAAKEAYTVVMSREQAGLLDIVKKEKDKWKALAMMITRLAGNSLLVPSWFPIALARELERYGSVTPDRDTIAMMRSKKKDNEIESIRKVQRAAESAMDAAITLIRNSKPRGGILYRGDDPLTSEAVRSQMHKVLLDCGCMASDTIVSCGRESAIPHLRGMGGLFEDQPIIIDIFPRDEQTGYYSDMSRTVCKGEPSEKIKEMYSAVRDAQSLASGRIRAGVSGAGIHQAVVDFFTDSGYPTGTKGFIHNLGHGVGLDIHELPSVGPGGGTLSSGNVITNEPGLYFSDVGGIRLEDIGVVTPDGFDCFTRFPKELVI